VQGPASIFRHRFLKSAKWLCTAAALLLTLGALIGIPIVPRGRGQPGWAVGLGSGAVYANSFWHPQIMNFDLPAPANVLGFSWHRWPNGDRYIRVPVWPFVLSLTTAAAFLWYTDRKRAPGSCHHCHYNLTGNTTGVCPECGKLLQ
jgi:hypothetical protein